MIRLATDVGGTFTDLVGYDERSGRIFEAKALTTPEDQSGGVLDTIAAAQAGGMEAGAIGFFAHGGTTVINAITERKGVRTALVTTAGFRDVLAIGRGNRPDLYNLRFASPEPFVPRHLRFEVRERLGARGEVVLPIVLDDLAPIAAACRAEGVEAVAIAFLHSYANPAHEEAAARRLADLLPGVTVCASHSVSREWREYERSNTVALNAYVQPIIRRYFTRLEAALRAEGVDCPYHAMLSNGGIATFAQATERPLTLVESGPAGGVAGAARIGQALGFAEVLSLDVGGTTAKCSLILDGRPRLDTTYRLEHSRLWPGYPVQVPVVDIVEIGAGGGSIAGIDGRGALRVGPLSAGSLPGPACYGRGGREATVTDALVTIGVFDPATFAGGRVPLDPDRARAAIAPVAGALRLSVEDAAMAILDVAFANMINALKLVTVQRGHDPRDAAFVVSGGAGPALAGRLGREMQVRCTVIPPLPGIFSAWGMLAARPRADFRATWFAPLDAAALAGAGAGFARLRAEAVAHFGQGEDAVITFDMALDARYHGQEHGVMCTLLPGDDLAAVTARFHATHRQAYTFRLDDSPIEITGLHLVAALEVPTIRLASVATEGRGLAASRKGAREVWFRDLGWTPCPVLDRDRMPVATPITGPLLLEEATTTTLVLPGQSASLTETGILMIREADGRG